MASTPILLLLLAPAAMAGLRHAGATEYTVGDSDGWTIGPNYLAWAQKYNFTTGYTLGMNHFRWSSAQDISFGGLDARCHAMARRPVQRSTTCRGSTTCTG